MRTIKFRAWDKEENKWLPEDKIAIDNYGNVYIAISEIGETVSVGDNDILWKFRLLTNSDRFIKVQFTGLKDKNGKEIWEGDWIRYRYKKYGEWFEGEVIFGNFKEDCEDKDVQIVGFYLHCFDRRRKEFWDSDMPQLDLEIEVIGNIYENPELIK